MQAQIKYQHEADPEWGRHISELPGCEKLFSCIQCGACSGTCPLSVYMDLTPRRTIALVREGFREDALRSQTIWLCASCYACAVDCPHKVGITDIMYALKREAIHDHLYPRRFPVPILARQFYELVRGHGRNSEFWLIMRLAMRSNPLAMLPMVKTGWNLLRTGRLPVRQERIRRIDDLQATPAIPRR